MKKDNATFEDLVKKVDGQVIRRGGYWSEQGIFDQLVNEVGELSRVINPDRPKKEEEKKLKVEEELADIFYAIICFAKIHNISLDDALLRKVELNEVRDKERFEER